MSTTPMTVFPGEIGANQDATLDRWHEIFQYAMRPGIVRSVAGDPFTSYTAELRIDTTGSMTVTVNPGRVWALGKVAKIAAVATLAITANVSGVTRYDLIVARFNLAASTAEVIVIDGGASPPVPTRNSTTYEVRLYVVTVTNGMAATTGALTDLREYMRAFAGPRYGVILGSTGVLQSGDGMSAISSNRQGAGVFRFAPDIAWPDTDFTVTAIAEHATTPLVCTVTAKATTYVEITCKNLSNVATDPTYLHCTVNHPRQNILGGT